MIDLALTRCARLPSRGLAGLASLRGLDEIRVVVLSEFLWVFWPRENVGLARKLLALPEVVFLYCQEHQWFFSSGGLPCFDVPNTVQAVSIPHLLSPEPIKATPAPDAIVNRVRLKLVANSVRQPTSALLLDIDTFTHWVERAWSDEIQAIEGVRSNNQVFLRGKLPPLIGEPFWGEKVFLPAGYRCDPDLPDAILHRALQLSPQQIALWTTTGLHRMAINAIRPLSRAGVRLAVRQLEAG